MTKPIAKGSPKAAPAPAPAPTKAPAAAPQAAASRATDAFESSPRRHAPGCACCSAKPNQPPAAAAQAQGEQVQPSSWPSGGAQAQGEQVQPNSWPSGDAQAQGEQVQPNSWPSGGAQAQGEAPPAPESPSGEVEAQSATAAPAGLSPEQLLQLSQHTLLREDAKASEANDEVAQMQQRLGLPASGRFDTATTEAVKKYQADKGLKVDGKVGQQTWASLLELGALEPGTTYLKQPGARAISTPQAAPGTAKETPGAADGVVEASFDHVFRAVPGEPLNVKASGKVAINGHTYDFNSGGGAAGSYNPWARGYLPRGTYTITPDAKSGRRARNNPTMQVGGVGWSFRLSDKYDPRVRDTRFGLLIHPDGRKPGTFGCLGIVGDANVQKLARLDLQTEVQRGGGHAKLVVG